METSLDTLSQDDFDALNKDAYLQEQGNVTQYDQYKEMDHLTAGLLVSLPSMYRCF